MMIAAPNAMAIRGPFLAAATCAVGAEVQIDEVTGLATFTRGDRTAAVYTYRDVPCKPYLKALYTPSGSNVLADAPPDHVHHHGLMFAIGVDAIDYWGEVPKAEVGRQVTRRTERTAGPAGAWLESVIDWRDPDDDLTLTETRRIELLPDNEAGDGPTLMTWRTELRAHEDVRLWGRHYFGLGMRFVASMSGAATFLHADGVQGRVYRGDEHLTPGRWGAARGDVEGRPVTVAMFDHPMNVRFPATWFTMAQPFAFMGATPNLEVQPRELREDDEPLSLLYGIAAWDGHVDRDEVEAVYERWKSHHDLLPDRVNIALAAHGTTVHASSAFDADYGAEKAIDGRFIVRETDKWNSAADFTPHYLRLDFGQTRVIDTIVVRHEGALSVLDAHPFNTADFHLQHAPGPWGPWTDLITPVRGNTDNVTVHRFDPVRTRYVRLLIETSEQNGGNAHGRIAEIEVYAPRTSLVDGDEKNESATGHGDRPASPPKRKRHG